MKQGKTSLTELAKEIETRANSKADYVADSRQLTVVPCDGDFENWASGVNLGIKEIGEFPLTNYAHSQIAGFTDIPKKYYDRMLEKDPNLLAINVNNWMQKEPKRRLIRTIDQAAAEVPGGAYVDEPTFQDLMNRPVSVRRARAFLSDRYRIMDNEEILESALPVIGEMKDVKIESCEVTDTRLWLKVIFPWLEDEIEHEGRKVGDIVQAGFVLGNSEIGCGKTFVDPLVFRLSCLNGARFKESGMSKFHVGRVMGEGRDAQEYFKDDTLKADDQAFMLKLRDCMRAAADEVQFHSLVDKMSETTSRKIEGDPLKSVEVVQKKFGLNDEEKVSVLTHLIQGGELSQFGISNAVTAASQDVEDYDRASDLERFGGQVIEMKRNDWTEIAKAA